MKEKEDAYLKGKELQADILRNIDQNKKKMDDKTISSDQSAKYVSIDKDLRK